jgi:hypothetical protein
MTTTAINFDTFQALQTAKQAVQDALAALQATPTDAPEHTARERAYERAFDRLCVAASQAGGLY